MSRHRALVRNASDPQQVRRAARKERDATARRLEAIRNVLQTSEGRRVFWDLLDAAGVFRSIWHPSAEIHYRAGRQDFGHEIMADIVAADETAFELLQREARARQRDEDRDTDAAHTAPARATTEMIDGRDEDGDRAG